MTKKYKATLIGLCFSIVSLFLTETFIIPIISVIPAAIILEGIYGNIFGKEPFNLTGWATLLTLALLLFIFSLLYFRLMVKDWRIGKPFEIGMFIGFLIIQSFIIHPLAFYLFLSENWDRAGDGQVFFGVFKTYPISCGSFIALGLITDLVRNKEIYIIKN